jgi:hypothetical protein
MILPAVLLPWRSHVMWMRLPPPGPGEMVAATSSPNVEKLLSWTVHVTTPDVDQS